MRVNYRRIRTQETLVFLMDLGGTLFSRPQVGHDKHVKLLIRNRTANENTLEGTKTFFYMFASKHIRKRNSQPATRVQHEAEHVSIGVRTSPREKGR